MDKRYKATKIVGRLMTFTRGEELAKFWAWEMTPMPVALPTWRQIRVGLAIAIGLDFIGRAYQRKAEREGHEAVCQQRFNRWFKQA